MILILKSWNRKQARHPEVDIESGTVAPALCFLCCYKHLKSRKVDARIHRSGKYSAANFGLQTE